LRNDSGPGSSIGRHFMLRLLMAAMLVNQLTTLPAGDDVKES
jgi:hypothetical protein